MKISIVPPEFVAPKGGQPQSFFPLDTLGFVHQIAQYATTVPAHS